MYYRLLIGIFALIAVIFKDMSANSIMAGSMVSLPSKSVGRVQQRSAPQRAAFGNTFMKGTSTSFAGQSLHMEAGSMTGSRKVTAMAAKGEKLNLLIASIV